MSDEIDVIKQEINKKADAVVFKPTAEKMTEEKSLNTLIRINKKDTDNGCRRPGGKREL